jgi:hypothetical protein
VLGDNAEVTALLDDVACDQRGDQVAAWQLQRRAGGFRGHAQGEGIPGAEVRHHDPELSAEAGPVRRVGEPLPRDRGRPIGQAGRRELRGAQELVPAEQVARRRDVRPGGQFPGGGGAGAAARQRRRCRVEDGGAVDRQPGRARVAQQHPVADVQRQRVAEPQPGVDRRRRPARVGRSQDPQPGLGAGGADVQQELGRELWLRVGGARGDADVELGGERPAARFDQGHAAGRQVRGDAPEVQRHPGDAGDLVGGLAQRLQPADADRVRRGGEQQFLAVPDGPGGQRAGDDGAGPPDGERAIDPEPHRPPIANRSVTAHPPAIAGLRGVPGTGERGDQAAEGGAEIIETLASDGADADRLDRAEAGFRDLGQGLTGRGAGVGQVGTGDDEDAVPDAERVHRRQVLGGLGHPAAVGRHDEHDGGDRAEAGQHVRHEPLVARHVHEREFLLSRRPTLCLQGEPGVAQVDGHAAPAFLRPSVGLHAGERPDQRGLPVVNVPGGGDHVH